ncbi:MAG: sigma-54-dependent transcriptional regulator [Planctomycetaceae bacterium]
MPSIIVIDDDRSILHLVQRTFEQSECHVVGECDARAGLEAVRSLQPDVVLLDILLEGTTGLEVFRELQIIDRKLPVIFITAEAASDTAIEAMQLGAFDYLAKPLDVTTLRQLVGKALKTREMMNVPVALGTEEPAGETDDLFVGRSPQMLSVFKAIGRVAAQNVPVLIRGESGTGKELAARALYQHSNRSHQPFMEVNCAAIPETLLESELFGHEKGAFTGADRRRIGKFEQCSGGTLFLDEIGDMPLALQSKVLRLLQDQRFERVGGNETIQADVRIISATNQSLEEMVDAGTFRSDLLYRINGVTIVLPPLRERSDDVKLLLQHFLRRATHDFNKAEIEGLSPEALDELMEYGWPGNVRELQAVVRQAVLNTMGTVIVPDFLPGEVRGGRPIHQGGSEPTPAGDRPLSDLGPLIERRLAAGTNDLYAETVSAMERYLITRVLRETGGNQSQAAEILGITRGKIRDRIATFGISLDTNVGFSPTK